MKLSEKTAVPNVKVKVWVARGKGRSVPYIVGLNVGNDEPSKMVKKISLRVASQEANNFGMS